MDSALRTVQRFLHIGNAVPYVSDPADPLDMEMGKAVLKVVVNPAPTQEVPKSESAPSGFCDKKCPIPDGKVAVADSNHEKETSPAPPVLDLLRTTMTNKTYRRADECLFALAYCAREFPTPEERHAVYELIPRLAHSSDLLHFISFYIQLAIQSGSAGFGRGLRKAIANWYEKFTPTELAEMLVRSVSTAGWTHKDVIAKAHPKLQCPIKQALLDAAMKHTSQLGVKKAPEKRRKRRPKESAEGNGNDVVVGNDVAIGNDVAVGNDVAIGNDMAIDNDMSKALQRYQALLQFKSASTVPRAIQLVKQHGGEMTLELFPRELRRSAQFWEVLYPNLTYRELLYAAVPMKDFWLLDEDDPNTRMYAEMLTKRVSLVEDERIHPIDVHLVAQLYESGKRYVTFVKEQFHQQLVRGPPAPIVLSCLNTALGYALVHQPKTDVLYYIALDLRSVHGKKRVLRNQVVTCFQASVMLAFSIFQREERVVVVAFTDRANVLTPVGFRRNMTWKQAVECCELLMVPKTRVSIAAPIVAATSMKVKVDVFLLITDSLVRVNPSRIPPVKEMQEYRKNVDNNLSRYVAISLSYPKPSFDFSQVQDTGGILEIAGYSAGNAGIIEAFANNLFF